LDRSVAVVVAAIVVAGGVLADEKHETSQILPRKNDRTISDPSGSSSRFLVEGQRRWVGIVEGRRKDMRTVERFLLVSLRWMRYWITKDTGKASDVEGNQARRRWICAVLLFFLTLLSRPTEIQKLNLSNTILL
jgi:hypothetical protein